MIVESNVDSILTNQDLHVSEVPSSLAEVPAEPEQTSNEYMDAPADSIEPVSQEEAGFDEYGTEISNGSDEMIPKKVMLERLERKNREIEHKILEERERIREEVRLEMSQRAPAQAEYQEGDSGDWQQELEKMIVNTTTKIQQQQQQEIWKQQERETQTQFEIKFNQGASKYQDFEQVVMGKSLTPQMVIATRGMNDPAAFIYAAAKTQAPELDRISKINDPYSQAIELGRLEERMKKSRSTTSAAPKPPTNIKGDAADKSNPKRGIDDLLIADQRARMRK